MQQTKPDGIGASSISVVNPPEASERRAWHRPEVTVRRIEEVVCSSSAGSAETGNATHS
jgi:hypothetical protein